MGDARDPSLVAHSPINAVKNVRHPVLIVYNPVPGRPGETQSEKMAHALKDVGQTAETLELPADEGWGTTSALRVRVLTTIETFLNKSTRVPP